MVREELFSLCEQFVRSRDAEAGDATPAPGDPAPEILRSYRLAEISESEMEALLAYVGDPDEEDCCQTAGIADESFDVVGPARWADDDDEPASPRRPR
jgi:hypothetical protein